MSNRTIFFGLILIIIGMVFLSRSLNILWFDIGDLVSMIFPVGFIVVGIWLIVRRKERQKAQQWHPPDEAASAGTYAADQTATASSTQQTASAGPTPAGPGPEEQAQQGARISEMPDYRSTGKLKYDKFVGDMFIDCANVNLQNIEVGIFVGDIEIKLHDGNLAPGLNRMVISGFVGDIRILIPREMAVYVQASNFIGDIELVGRSTSGFGNNLDAQTANYQAAESKLFIASNQFVGDVRAYIV